MSSMLKGGGSRFKPKVRKPPAKSAKPQPSTPATASDAPSTPQASIEPSIQESQPPKDVSTENAAQGISATTSGLPGVNIDTNTQPRTEPPIPPIPTPVSSSTEQDALPSTTSAASLEKDQQSLSDSASTVLPQSSASAINQASSPHPVSQTSVLEQPLSPAVTQSPTSIPKDGASQYGVSKSTPASEPPTTASPTAPSNIRQTIEQTTPGPEPTERRSLPAAPLNGSGVQSRTSNFTPAPERLPTPLTRDPPSIRNKSQEPLIRNARANFTAPLSPAPFQVSDTITAIPPPNETAQPGPPNAAAPKPKRAYRKRKAQTEGDDNGEDSSAPRKPRKVAQKKARTNKQNGEGGAETPQVSRRRRRAPTPEDAENQVIDRSTMKLGELTRDLGIGKPFKYKETVLERERQARMERKAKIEKKRLCKLGLLPPESEDGDGDGDGSRAGIPVEGAEFAVVGEAAASAPAGNGVAPRFKICDGQIVIDNSSLVVEQDNGGRSQQIETVEEDEFSHPVTSASYRRASRQTGSNKWSDMETELFYECLQQFGTDFDSMVPMLPGRNRRQIKLKFNREEKVRPNRINAAVKVTGKKKTPIDLLAYKERMGSRWLEKDKILEQQEAQKAENQRNLEAYKEARRTLGNYVEDEEEEGVEESATPTATAPEGEEVVEEMEVDDGNPSSTAVTA